MWSSLRAHLARSILGSNPANSPNILSIVKQVLWIGFGYIDLSTLKLDPDQDPGLCYKFWRELNKKLFSLKKILLIMAPEKCL